jgi:phage terminase large subunit GpA-like protein
MNARGRWLHETGDGARAVPLGDPEIRGSDIASYWMQGAAAALSTWAGIVSQYVAARRAYDDAGDVEGLRAVLNTAHALPFKRPARRGEKRATAEALQAAADDRPLGIVPAEARLIIAAVDVQAGALARFEVQVEAWGVAGRRWLVDRYAITRPPAGAPGAAGRRIDPATFAEDWAALHAVAAKIYPIAGAAYGLRAAAVAVDSGGAAGVTDLAYAHYRAERIAGRARGLYLVRPVGGIQPGLAWIQAPKRGSKGRAAATDIPLLYVATDRAKDAVSAALERPAGAERAYRLTRHAPATLFAEMTAEEPTPQGWRLRRGETRNEALDLAGYGLGAATVMKADRLAPDARQDWAIAGARNCFAVALSAERVALAAAPASDAPGQDPAPPLAPVSPAPAPTRGRRIRGRSRFITG